MAALEGTIRLALLGQPNSGKSTIFNTLTGARQHVGNWPGKTVERKEGRFSHNGRNYRLTDLPGSYSLSANSDEERITREHIAGGEADLVLILADGSQLERSLYMLADYAGIETPAMLVVTMLDVAEQQGKTIDLEKLSTKLGIPVTGVVAPERKSYKSFFETLEAACAEPRAPKPDDFYAIYRQGEKKADFAAALELISEPYMAFSREWLASKLMEQDEAVITLLSEQNDAEAIRAFAAEQDDGALFTGDCKFSKIEELLDGVVEQEQGRAGLLSKFDRVAISRRWGKPLALGIVILGLIASFVAAAPIMGLGAAIPPLLNPLVDRLADINTAPILIAFIKGTFVNALYWTVNMLGFVFGVNLVFGLLEEVGYMARISYVFDGSMSKLGLQGKSIMPLLISVGCTIGGTAGTRVIDSWGQRLLTIALAWAVPCAATFAVIPTLAAAFFGWAGIFVMVLIFLIMLLHIRLTALVFGRKLSPKAERHGLIMELPPYHKPRWGMLFRQTLNRVWGIFKKTILVVMSVSAVFFLLSYSADGRIEESILYKVGIAIEPVTRFFGMGWKTFMAFVSSMISKEAVLGVLSAIFTGTGNVFGHTIGSAAADADVGRMMVSAIPKAEALAFMIAVTFNIPCLMAVASTYQESHSLKWTGRIALYYVATALVLSSLVYHIASLLM